MKKAKYIKTYYLKDCKLREYIYRGKKYTLAFNYYGEYIGIEMNAAGGHKNEQARIDEMLDVKLCATSPADEGFKLFWDFAEK